MSLLGTQKTVAAEWYTENVCLVIEFSKNLQSVDYDRNCFSIPVLAPCDFTLFPHVKIKIEVMWFSRDEDLRK